MPSQPEWGIAMLLSNNSTINWGPWCDRQRDLIWRFFNPIDHSEWQLPTDPTHRKFKFELGKIPFLLPLHVTTSIIEFSSKLDGKRSKNRSVKFDDRKKNRINFEFLGDVGQTRKMSVNVGENSRFELNSPSFPTEDHFKMEMDLNLKNVTCSLESEDLKRFVNSDELSLHLETQTPTFYNKPQLWKFNIELKGSNVLFVWRVKQFLTDLINDWSPDKQLDLVDYVPVTYEFDIRCHHLEVLIPVNQYNYVDCLEPISGIVFAKHT